MRGERTIEVCDVDDGRGSSPHARGTRHPQFRQFGRGRFIPACAGNARSSPSTFHRRPVHPRMRGERCSSWPVLGVNAGSSPHARGTLEGSFSSFFVNRFIPACAGNAFLRQAPPFRVTVHPRMRGERLKFGDLSPAHNGSSPHARGTHDSACPALPGTRFIPACAGNAPPGWRWSAPPAVHPRMRGERPPADDRLGPERGSSPHARGTQPWDFP
ncbi:hypothetical protein MIN45_P2354 [Methylomarinovum tepidoasis]|uniref:Uncharacterized protein n=1 Tax=Methylomarinovum tepidoasis TaxID=2840183 RepID=A0AAU9CZ40_9GAMM|nr:hypothetical protein MIN45_P2354 [Methylomarinovum sp. IN45]